MDNFGNEIVDASPTKDFFIYMLTRDIDIRPAIVELIDNAIDGAKKIRINNMYEGLKIQLILNTDEFIIEDNCGGIDIETATKYAFKFGRSASREKDYSAYFTGIFGIGMKRALFKLGKEFTVISTTKTEHFQMDVNVDEWIKSKDWNFKIHDVGRKMNNDVCGTKIIVKRLNNDIALNFDNEYFINTLIDYIQKYRNVESENGLSIIVNNYTIDYGKEKLIELEDIQPYKNKIIDEQGNITIVAGITKRGEPKKAGWYVYCNGRLVLYADKSSLTGWGDGNREYHPSLAEFRGYVYFESKDLLLLPWNTTKTGVDTSNRMYIIAREKMNEAMTQVFKVISETKNKYDVTSLDQLSFVVKAKEMQLSYSNISQIRDNKDFAIGEPEKVIPMSTILFKRPTEDVDNVKKKIGASSNKALGEKLFDYYCEMEGM